MGCRGWRVCTSSFRKEQPPVWIKYNRLYSIYIVYSIRDWPIKHPLPNIWNSSKNAIPSPPLELLYNGRTFSYTAKIVKMQDKHSWTVCLKPIPNCYSWMEMFSLPHWRFEIKKHDLHASIHILIANILIQKASWWQPIWNFFFCYFITYVKYHYDFQFLFLDVWLLLFPEPWRLLSKNELMVITHVFSGSRNQNFYPIKLMNYLLIFFVKFSIWFYMYFISSLVIQVIYKR